MSGGGEDFLTFLKNWRFREGRTSGFFIAVDKI
jgi:hypothetical protein